MARRPLCSTALALALLLASSALADAPRLLNYQGRLTDPAGNPKNGSFTMTFAVYGAASGGAALPAGSPWSETHTVPVAGGVFNVLLGSVTPLPANLLVGDPSDTAGPLRFLQVTVNGETLAPRRRITSAAYALDGKSQLVVRDASGKKVGTVVQLDDDGPCWIVSLAESSFALLRICRDGFEPRPSDHNSTTVYFESSDCTGAPLILPFSWNPGVKLLWRTFAVVVDPAAEPGATLYLPTSSPQTRTAQSELAFGDCNPLPGGFTESLSSAEAIPLFNVPGAKFAFPLSVDVE